MKSKTRRL